MCNIAAGKLAMAATIAVRYSCCRRQGFEESSSPSGSFLAPEKQIIDYQVQALRLFTQVGLEGWMVEFLYIFFMLCFYICMYLCIYAFRNSYVCV